MSCGWVVHVLDQLRTCCETKVANLRCKERTESWKFINLFLFFCWHYLIIVYIICNTIINIWFWLCEKAQLLIFVFYASGFRRRRHYVLGLSVCLSVHLKPEIPSFHLCMGPLVHPTNPDCLRHVRPSVIYSNAVIFTVDVHPSVCPSGEVLGHLPENAWRQWPEILHAAVSWPPSEVIRLWLWSVDICGPWRTRGRNGLKILHVDVSWSLSQLIRLWSPFVDFSHFGAILT